MNDNSSSARKRLSLMTLDQIVAGASNVLTALLAAQLLDVGSFGLFALIFLIYAVAQGVHRALVGDPLLVHPEEADERPGSPLGTGLAVGVLMAVVLLLLGLLSRQVWEPPFGNSLMILAACLPLLALQDLGRYLGIATHRPGTALRLDVTWLVLMLVPVGFLVATDSATLERLVLSWAGSGAVAGLLVVPTVVRAGLRLDTTWVRTTWSISWRYLSTYALTQGSALGAALAVGTIAGSAALGGVRGALLVIRPYGAVQTAAMASGIAEVSRSDGARPTLRRHERRTTFAATGAALLMSVVLLGVPDAVGRVVLGETWDATDPLLLAASAQLLLQSLAAGPRAVMLGLKEVRTALRIDVASTIAMMVFGIAGTVLDGAEGGMWGFALSQACSALAWRIVLARRQAVAPEEVPVTTLDGSAHA
ncbi:oligosaccharide flippase family protein [Nocardioides sp. SYSU D00038]|uniref:oligosaccharide flippase family protein n=1 Tax=Nocardioides sp. SYSU D00038 TaxID=2812554 RepID=UPI001966D28F|nr:oligosaccharide flippase family protein [Nocardioides sp. SYSU D00038]